MSIALSLFVWAALDYLPKFGIDIYPIGCLFATAFALIVTYAILRHQLFDITIVIRKSVVYSILVALITATYFLFVLLTERVLQGVMGYRTLAPSLLTAFVIALGFTPLKDWVQSSVDRLFFKGTAAAMAAENERLKQELERSERLKAASILATGLAHEIKNPLSAIRTFVSYLPERYQEAEFREKFMRIVGGQVERINEIVQQLLHFAKPAPPEFRPTHVNGIIQETLAFLSNEALKHRVDVSTDLRANHAPILADSNQLRQVFLNLFLNSLEAMDKGGRLEVVTTDAPGGVEITVSDTGSGIPQEVMAHLFEPFYTTKETGVGLGLPIVKCIIERHGGTIGFASQPQQGTQVTIVLPQQPHVT